MEQYLLPGVEFPDKVVSMKVAYDELVKRGFPVPAWPNMDKIGEVRKFGAWFYIRQKSEPLMKAVLAGCRERVAQLRKERSERILARKKAVR